MEKYREIEKSIIKKYRKPIWSKFIKAIKQYELIGKDDKIAVCISGGKDSFLLAKCMDELKRHGIFKFDLEFIVMNPGYSDEKLSQIKKNLELLNIKAHIFKTDIFDIVSNNVENPCYMCAKMRRGYLYNEAQKLGCNKIALGHHFDDVIETILLNQIFNGNYSSMMPKLCSDNFKGMELIRPLYLIYEEDIKNWVNYNSLEFLDCACLVTKKDIGKRIIIKDLIKKLKEIHKDAANNILTATTNVNLNTIIAYKQNDTKKTFLDNYGFKK